MPLIYVKPGSEKVKTTSVPLIYTLPGSTKLKKVDVPVTYVDPNIKITNLSYTINREIGESDIISSGYYYGNTNAFLASYNVYVKKLSANATGQKLSTNNTLTNIMDFIRLGYPVIVYENKTKTNEATNETVKYKQYYLLLQSSEQSIKESEKMDSEKESSIDKYKIYVVNPTDNKFEGVMTLKNFASSVNIEGAYALTDNI